METALALDGSLFRGRQINVSIRPLYLCFPPSIPSTFCTAQQGNVAASCRRLTPVFSLQLSLNLLLSRSRQSAPTLLGCGVGVGVGVGGGVAAAAAVLGAGAGAGADTMPRIR